jgi:hypothetical protein
MSLKITSYNSNSQIQQEFNWRKAARYAAYGALAVGTVAAIGAIGTYLLPNIPTVKASPESAAGEPALFTHKNLCPSQDLTAQNFPDRALGYPIAHLCPSQRLLHRVSEYSIDICGPNSALNIICEQNLGIPRNQMPQLNPTTLSAFVDFKRSQGIEVTTGYVEPRSLTPIQKEMNSGKIAEMMKSAITGSWDPCASPTLIADNSVIDGHHRWATCVLLNRPFNAIRVHDTAVNVLADLRHFPGVFSEGLNVFSAG